MKTIPPIDFLSLRIIKGYSASFVSSLSLKMTGNEYFQAMFLKNSFEVITLLFTVEFQSVERIQKEKYGYRP